MNIIVAKSAGYCFGVRDAVNMAYETAEKYGDVYMLGDIVHNERVVSDLEKAGAKVVKNLDEIPKDSPVLFRAHGTKTDIWKEAKEINLNVIDATCPLVSKVHREAENLNKKGGHILLIGHRNHPEVIGTMGQLENGGIDLIENIEDAKNYQNKSNKELAYVTQTTLSVDDTKDIIAELKRKFPEIKEPKKDDICYATTNRQSAVKKIASFCDMFFAVSYTHLTLPTKRIV